MHAKLARLVARGGHDTARPRTTNRDRNPAKRGIVTLAYGGIESVHIDADDAAEIRRQIGSMRHVASDVITTQPASELNEASSFSG
jgi:hypothetical protein